MITKEESFKSSLEYWYWAMHSIIMEQRR